MDFRPEPPVRRTALHRKADHLSGRHRHSSFCSLKIGCFIAAIPDLRPLQDPGKMQE
jgi:hypothetical protein